MNMHDLPTVAMRRLVERADKTYAVDRVASALKDGAKTNRDLVILLGLDVWQVGNALTKLRKRGYAEAFATVQPIGMKRGRKRVWRLIAEPRDKRFTAAAQA